MISRIEALNYRGLRYVRQELRPFQVLVGPNASGKSTFLDVVALLRDFVRYGLDKALLFGIDPGQGRASRFEELIFNQQGEYFDLAVEFIIPSELRKIAIDLDEIELRRNEERTIQRDHARYEVSFGLHSNGEMYIRAETLWLINRERRPEEPHALDRHIQLGLFPLEPQPPYSLITSGKTPQGWQTVVRKVAESGNDYYKAEGGKWNIMYRIGPRRAALAGLPEDANRFPISLWVRNLLLDGVRVLALNSAAMRRPVSPSLSRSFSVDGANLPLVVQDLERNHPQAFADWVAHLRTILPDLKTLSVHERPEDRHLYLAISYTSTQEPVPSWLVSDGTLRLLALTLLAYLPDQSSIYLIEEPENGIHPKALEGVFQSLSSVYSGQILVATHSPLFLSLAEPQQLLCFARNPSGAVDIVSGERHPALQNWKGQIDLATLYAAGVLG